MAKRKLWVGVSEPHDHAPSDFITFIVICDEEIDEGMEMARDYFKNDLADAEYMEGAKDGSDDIRGSKE